MAAASSASGHGIKLLEEDDAGGAVAALLALDTQLVADLAGADEQALCAGDAGFGQNVLEVRTREVFDRRDGVGMAQHALGREDDERLAPLAQGLAAQEVEILRGSRGLADLNVVVRSELEIALDARAGVLRALALVAVGQEQDDAAEQAPLVFAGGDELVDDDLRAVGEVAELGFPEDEGFGVVAAVSVLEAEHAGFGEDGVVDVEVRLVGREMAERDPGLLVFDVDENGVALVEGAALAVLSAEADGRAGGEKRSEGNGLGHAVVEGALALAHLRALFQ